MPRFPVLMELNTVLICGGGRHAVEKLEKLRPFRPRVQVISPDIGPEMEARAAELPSLTLVRRAFAESDLTPPPTLVITAESHEENARISQLCRKHRVLVNAVDQPEDCDFFFPALFTAGELCVSVSTGGTSPTAAIALRNRMKAEVPTHIDAILDWLTKARETLRQETMNRTQLQSALHYAVSASFRLDRPLTDEELAACCWALKT